MVIQVTSEEHQVVDVLFFNRFVLVLKTMKQTFSESLHRGLYGVNELLRTVRELCLMVAEPATVPESFEMHRWGSFQLDDLRLSATRESQIYRTFEAHRVYYTCGGGVSDSS